MDDIVEHFTRFAAERRKMRAIDPNEILTLHSGHEREIALTLADLERAAATITALRSALRECADDLEIATKRLAATKGRLPDPKKMAPVLRARALLEPSATDRETTS